MAIEGTIATVLPGFNVAIDATVGTPPIPPVQPDELHLKIGRTGMEVALAHPYQITQRPSGQYGRTVTIQGHIKDTSSLKDANALRESLLAQAGRLLPVACAVDPSIDGFYHLVDAQVELSHALGSLTAEGFFPYSITLEYAATQHLVSALTGGVMPNDHGITTNPRWIGRSPLQFMAAGPVASTGGSRVGSEGAVKVGQMLPQHTLRYGIMPADYYHGSSRVYVAGNLIAGENIPADIHDPMDWEIHNTLARVAPISGGFRMSMWSASLHDWVSSFDVQILDEPTGGSMTLIDGWRAVQILRNDPEEVTVRLQQSRSGSGGMRVLDITLRRGMRHVHCYYQVTFTQDALHLQVIDGSSAVVSPWGLRRSASDENNNRWFIGTRFAHTTNTGANLLTRDVSSGPAPRNVLDFFASHIAGGAQAADHDKPNSIASQYLTYVTERVTPLSPSDTSLVR